MTRRRTAAAAQRGGAAAGALKRGPWTPEEDELLARAVARDGEGRWRTLPRRAGLLRCGKSCRLRWMNYLRPDIKRGPIAADEEDLILRLHRLLGNRWSLIAGRLPGRTDNEIKNYWNSHLSKKLIAQGIDPRTHRPLPAADNSHDGAPAAAAAPAPAADKTEPVEPSVAPPPPAHPSPSSAAVDGGGDFAATMMISLDAADGFEGFDDQFCAGGAARGDFDMGCTMLDDAAFSLFLDSLINEDRPRDGENVDGENDQGGAS